MSTPDDSTPPQAASDSPPLEMSTTPGRTKPSAPRKAKGKASPKPKPGVKAKSKGDAKARVVSAAPSRTRVGEGKRRPGGQPRNRNAVGHGAPPGPRHGMFRHGLYASAVDPDLRVAMRRMVHGLDGPLVPEIIVVRARLERGLQLGADEEVVGETFDRLSRMIERNARAVESMRKAAESKVRTDTLLHELNLLKDPAGKAREPLEIRLVSYDDPGLPGPQPVGALPPPVVTAEKPAK